MLIVKSGVVPISSSLGLFVCPFQNWEPVLSFACVPCSTTSRCMCFFKCSWRMTYLLCLKKNCQTRYSLLNVLIISFLAFCFHLQILFYLLVLHTSYFKSFWVWNKLLTDATLGVILYSEVVLNKQIPIFTITEIFLRISNSNI